MTASQKKRLALFFFLDVLAIGIGLVIFSLFHHVLPRSIGHLYGTSELGSATDFSRSFPDKFTTDGTVVQEDGFYMDSHINLTVTTHVENGVTYYLADFYIKNIECLRSAFAGEEFSLGETDSVLHMANENNAVLAVSGDYFGIRQRSVVIRNGKVYRKTRAHQICVLYYDGTMETYPFASFDVEKAIAGGAWQAWDFGPALLNSDGSAVTEFSTGISGKNPRIAIGYYEPGHYCLVAVDGRQSHSSGMSLVELAKLFESLGCKTAYNLDGGNSAVMCLYGELFSSPSTEGGRAISDIIYLAPQGGNKEEK
ncbi:MAG: phosphodiester glycosidase family protein [Clostridia bacterium]|nr:phosphodiester glycosidase family protein [Clostridia bacterium]